MRSALLLFAAATFIVLALAGASMAVDQKLTINQYYDIETNNVSAVNTPLMDFQCTTTGDNQAITPVNNARRVYWAGNSELFLNNSIGYAWRKTAVNLRHPSQSVAVVYFYTNEGNYARIPSYEVGAGWCQFRTITTGITLSRYPVYVGSIPGVSTTSVQINNSAGVFIDSKSMGYGQFPNGTIIDVGGWTGALPYWKDINAYLNVGNSTHGPINTIYYPFTQKSYMTNTLNCLHDSEYRSASNITNWNEGSTFVTCIYDEYIDPQPLTFTGPLANGMQALLHLDEDGSTCPLFVDSTNQDNGAVCIANPTRKVNGVFDYGQAFDYSDYRILSLSNLTYNPVDFSVSIWARPNATAYVPDMKQTMVTKSSSWLLWQQADDSPFLWVWDQDATLYTVTAAINITGNWHNIAFTVSNTTKTAKLYVDGVLLNTGSMPTYNYANPTNEAVLLGLMGGYDQLYNGELDELAIWNRTLSDAEIYEVYNKKNNLVLNEIAGGIMINQTSALLPNYNYANYTLVLSLYNMSLFNIITEVSRNPINPTNGVNVTVTWISTMNSTGTLYYRYANYTGSNLSLLNYTAWYPIDDLRITNTHQGKFMVYDNKAYQYYVTAGSAVANNSGSYYSFVVGSAGGYTTGQNAIPNALRAAQTSGLCSGSLCYYLLGILLTVGVTGLGLYIGGLQIGLLFLSSCLVVLPLAGLLPIELLIPVIVVIALWLSMKFGLLGGSGE